jgi:hypothetical protein
MWGMRHAWGRGEMHTRFSAFLQNPSQVNKMTLEIMVQTTHASFKVTTINAQHSHKTAIHYQNQTYFDQIWP